MKLFRIIYTGTYIICITVLLALGCKGKKKTEPCKGHLIVVHQGHWPDKFNYGDTVQYIPDTVNNLEYLEQGYATPIDSFHSRLKFAGGDSIEAVIIGDGGGVTSFTDSGFDRTVTPGFKRVHHKKKLTDWSKFVDRYDTIKFAGPDTNKKQYWNGQEITHAQDSGWTVGDADFKITPAGTKAINLPYFQVDYRGTVIHDSTGTVATRDTSGNWNIKDPARALEVMYKIINHPK